MAKRNRKSDDAYTELRRQIMVAELPPNSLIDEKALVEELGVGRTPLREAVLRLEQQGLVTSMGRRGYVVAGASQADLMRCYELRRELECFTASLAAERRTAEDLEQFDQFLARIEAEIAEHEQEVIWHLAVDEEFHGLVAQASDNRFAQSFLASLYGLSVRSLYVSQVPITFVKDEIDTYHTVLNAIRMRDAAAARAAMAQHLTFGPIQLKTSASSQKKLGI
jgi:GntR family transcriptional regulator, rspAB operon transcriptional repressor